MTGIRACILAFLVGAMFLPACGPGKGKKKSPSVVARVKQTLDLREGVLRLRYNPSVCSCPPFEVQTDGGWIRARILPRDEGALKDDLLARAGGGAPGGGVDVYEARASLASSSILRCTNQVPYVELYLEPPE
jgi:hypothetical protein